MIESSQTLPVEGGIGVTRVGVGAVVVFFSDKIRGGRFFTVLKVTLSVSGTYLKDVAFRKPFFG